jgi:hypothetical protein
MIQAIYKGVEIELESHQQTHGMWKCDYTLVMSPDGSQTRSKHRGETEFPTKDLADENALQAAHDAIDKDTKGQPEEKIANPPRQVRI